MSNSSIAAVRGRVRERDSVRVDSFREQDKDGITQHIPLQLRGSRVQIESLRDDYRNAPLEQSLRSSLVIPDCAKEPSRLGKVVAIGDGRLQDGERHVFSVEVGDTVLCPRYPVTGSGVKWRGKELFFMSETEILAKVTNG